MINLKGIVIAADWGPNGEVLTVDIAGYDEKRYRVSDDPKGRLLKEYIQAKVVVEGKVGNEKQQEVIFVQNFWLDDAESD